jgi:hypothetical protein
MSIEIGGDMSQELTEDWRWKAKRGESAASLATARQAKEMACEMKARHAAWGEKFEREADALIASFEFFLSANPVPSSYRFVAWIDHPKQLVEEIHSVQAMFKALDEEAAQKLAS